MFPLLVLVSAAFGQINTTNSVTVTAGPRQTATPPDQVIFTVTIEAGLSVTINDLITALKGTGLSATNFVNVYSSQQYTPATNQPFTALEWIFQVAVPLGGMKAETAVLKALQTSLKPLTLTYTLQAQTSTQALVQSCSLSDLVSTGHTQAQQLATAANLVLGNIAAIATYISTRIGPAAPLPYVAPACSLTMTFGLGQASQRTLTVSASRSVSVTPDQVVLGAYVDTAADGTVDDAIAALAGTGLTAANLINVNPLYSQSGNEWVFSVTVPLAKLTDSLAAFRKAQNGVSGSAGIVTAVSFAVLGTQVSSDLAAAQDCTKAALVSDAQAYARRVAAAAGVALNGILAINDGGAQTSGAFFALASLNTVRSGDFSLVSSVLTSPQPNCSVTVQFGFGQ
jgi:uncharacterized protein YggE